MEFDAEFKFAKIQNSHFRGGGGGGEWNQLSTVDAKFKFAKIQNSHFQGWGVGGTNFQLFMLSSNLLKSKIPISGGKGGGGGIGGTNFQLLMLSLNLLKKKKKSFCEKFSKFSGQKLERICFRLWVPSGSPYRRLIGEPQLSKISVGEILPM